MKKILFLLVAAMMLTFTVQASAAPPKGTIGEDQDGATYMWDGDSWEPAELLVEDSAKAQGGKVYIVDKNNLNNGELGTQPAGANTGDKIKVYRKTCRGYRCIGCICASKLSCLPPGDDYILVKKCFSKYCWVKVCCNN